MNANDVDVLLFSGLAYIKELVTLILTFTKTLE